MSELETFLEENPKFKKELSTPSFVSVLRVKPLKRILDLGENIAMYTWSLTPTQFTEKYGTTEQIKIKTFEIVKKHMSVENIHNMNDIIKEYKTGH